MDRSDLANRMKEFYETIPKTKLMRRCPVVVRLDMRTGHTFCRGFERPFDEVFIKSMQETAKYMCENVQGCVLSYQQSDEISLILVDYKKLNSSAFFDYEVQKVCSITASMATMAFNKYFSINMDNWGYDNMPGWIDGGTNEKINPQLKKLCDSYIAANEKGAMFDSRCFNIPKEEVTNYIYWRQLDASRNSIQMVGQADFSHKELHKKTTNQIQDMLMTQKGINWNDFPAYQKRGSCCIKEIYYVGKNGEEVPVEDSNKDDVTKRSRWIIDKNIPIFKCEGRQYIENLIR